MRWHGHGCRNARGGDLGLRGVGVRTESECGHAGSSIQENKGARSHLTEGREIEVVAKIGKGRRGPHVLVRVSIKTREHCCGRACWLI